MNEQKDEKINVERKIDYIKPYVLVNFGKEIATILGNAYNASSATEKLKAASEIIKCDLKDEAKIKFIGDIMIRPKKERFAIAKKIFKLLEDVK